MRIATVAESFAAYRAAVLPPDASAVQVLECERAFYGGAFALLMGALLKIGDVATDEDDGVAQLEAIRAECVAFAAAGAATPPAPPPITVPDIHHEAPAPLVADLRPVLERLAHRIGDDLPAGWGFALFLFTLGAAGHTFYIANVDRGDVLTALHDFIRRQTS